MLAGLLIQTGKKPTPSQPSVPLFTSETGVSAQRIIIYVSMNRVRHSCRTDTDAQSHVSRVYHYLRQHEQSTASVQDWGNPNLFPS